MSGVWHITVGWKIVDKFSKMLYQKNENVLWKASIFVYCMTPFSYISDDKGLCFLKTCQNMDFFF
jgi:hypothetical protein